MGFQRARYQDLDVYVPYLILLHFEGFYAFYLLLGDWRPVILSVLCFFDALGP